MVGNHSLEMDDLPIAEVAAEDGVWLGQPLEEVEVEAALWGLPNTKASEPNEMHGVIFRNKLTNYEERYFRFL